MVTALGLATGTWIPYAAPGIPHRVLAQPSVHAYHMRALGILHCVRIKPLVPENENCRVWGQEVLNRAIEDSEVQGVCCSWTGLVTYTYNESTEPLFKTH